MTAQPSFIPGVAESRTYVVRSQVLGARFVLSRDPSNSNPETTNIEVPCHGQGGEPDSPDQIVWFNAMFGDCAGLRETWDGCWSVDDGGLAAILETRLAAMADLGERLLKTSVPDLIPVVLSARPPVARCETLHWVLRWFPGMEASHPRYAVVHTCASREPRSITAYGVHYGQGTTAAARPSEWFRLLTGNGLGPAPSTRDPAGREVAVTTLEKDGLARVVDAMLALPGEAVDYFYAKWQLG